MEYDELDHEEFDAIVTGELTHYALWLEDEINGIICDYFMGRSDRKGAFRRLILYRDGLTFQDKLEICRGMVPLLGAAAEKCNLKSILKEIEQFKSWRNALAHGMNTGDSSQPRRIIVEVVNRAGKEKRIEITPDSHRKMVSRTEELLRRIQGARNALHALYTDA